MISYSAGGVTTNSKILPTSNAAASSPYSAFSSAPETISNMPEKSEANENSVINNIFENPDCDKDSNSEALHLLSTNALPPYNPGTVPEFLSNSGSTEIHCCSDCGDMFFCKSSLTFHLQRRSTLIRFSCDSCKKLHVFFNRCSLLSHIRAHAEKNEISDISKATLAPLPRVLMEGIRSDVMKNLEEDDGEQNESRDGAITPTKVLEMSMIEEDDSLLRPTGSHKLPDNVEHIDRHTTVVNTISETSVTEQTQQSHNGSTAGKFSCSECSKDFNTSAERKEHFMNGDKIPVMISICSKCGILCPSECSFKAHKRLHLQISPYVCPECGNNPDRYWDAFQKHLRYQCFHYSRIVGYKCRLCRKLCHSADLLKRHLNNEHTEVLYKCQICPMAFTAFSNFHSHRKKTHANSSVSHDQFVKCGLCDVVFKGKKDIDFHLVSHIKENACQYLFTCPDCNVAHDSKRGIQKHLYQYHPKTYQQYEVYITMADEAMFGPKKSDSDLSLNSNRIECLICHASFPSQTSYVYHLSKAHTNHMYPCGVCHKAVANRLDMISHGKDHLRKNVPLCLLCHNKRIKPPEVLDVHLLYHIERVRFRTFCPVCDKPLSSFQGALQHLRLEHFLRRQPKRGPGSQNTQNSREVELIEMDRNPQNALEEETGLDASAGDANHSKDSLAKRANISYDSRLQTGENCCIKCPYMNNNREEFKKHIMSHKESKSSFQCQECGQCFVVEPPLKMHLKIAHKVLDTDGYLAKEGTNHTPEAEVIGLPETTPNALECTVCFEIFLTEAQLRTHMRSHGMAFIQAKKTAQS